MAADGAVLDAGGTGGDGSSRELVEMEIVPQCELLPIDEGEELGHGKLHRKPVEVGHARRGFRHGTSDIAA
jgi:hypothetical protein